MTKGKKQMDGTKRCRIEFGLSAGESLRAIAEWHRAQTPRRSGGRGRYFEDDDHSRSTVIATWAETPSAVVQVI